MCMCTLKLKFTYTYAAAPENSSERSRKSIVSPFRRTRKRACVRLCRCMRVCVCGRSYTYTFQFIYTCVCALSIVSVSFLYTTHFTPTGLRQICHQTSQKIRSAAAMCAEHAHTRRTHTQSFSVLLRECVCCIARRDGKKLSTSVPFAGCLLNKQNINISAQAYCLELNVKNQSTSGVSGDP